MWKHIAIVIRGLGLAAQAPKDQYVKKLGDNLYGYVPGNDFSSNSTFLIGPDGILVVDTGFDGPEAGKLLAEIRKISPLPVRYIINTHDHRDHQAGNGIVGPDATIITTEFTRARTLDFVANLPSQEQRLTGAALESLRSTAFRAATATYETSMKLYIGNTTVEIYHPGRGHTGGDTLVYFSPQNVVSTGDLLMNHSCPSMDATNGSVLNWIKTLDTLLTRPIQFAVPGHFDIASKADVQSFRDYLAGLRDQVTALAAAGASLQQVRDGLQMS